MHGHSKSFKALVCYIPIDVISKNLQYDKEEQFIHTITV